MSKAISVLIRAGGGHIFLPGTLRHVTFKGEFLSSVSTVDSVRWERSHKKVTNNSKYTKLDTNMITKSKPEDIHSILSHILVKKPNAFKK